MIKFWKTTDEYGFLSNFSRHPIELEGKKWPTTEHYYQAMKTTDPDQQEAVRKAKTPKQSKELAYTFPCRDDWEDIKFNVMLKALRAKADQYEFISEMLIDSGDETLAEDSPRDAIWGLGKDGNGQNLLGKAWMQIRKELQGDQQDEDESRYKTIRLRAEYLAEIDKAMQEAEEHGYEVFSVVPVTYSENKLGQVHTTTDVLIVTRRTDSG